MKYLLPFLFALSLSIQGKTQIQSSCNLGDDYNIPYIVIDGDIDSTNNNQRILSQIYSTLSWPNVTFDGGTIEGLVVVELFLNSSGHFIDVQIIKSLHRVFDEEAVKTIGLLIHGMLQIEIPVLYYQ